MRLSTYLFAILYGVTNASDSFAFDWRLRPSVSMSEIFSDNLNLSENAKKSGFVTEVDPGLSLYGSSPWSNLNLNYRLQGLYNAGGREELDINHQLQMRSLYQAIRNTLFLETTSSINQMNTSNSFIATDNISGNGNRTETKSFGISPYWTPHFGQYANGLFKVGYNRSTFDSSSDNTVSQQFPTSISDSETFSRQARLTSGSKFNLVRWGLNYSSQEQNRVDGDDVRFEQYGANSRYYINRKFNVFADVGYENNAYSTASNNVNNGFFYTIGGQWTPSKWYSLEVGLGNNKHVTLHYSPSNNLTSTVTYRNKDVGLNTGNSWDALLNYRVGQANWGFKYSQETTTVQQMLVEQGFFTVDAFGQMTPVDNPDNVPPEQQLYLINLPSLVDDVLIRKNGILNFSYRTGKSSYSASVFNERRTYEVSNLEDNVYGISGKWQWQFAPRLNFYLQPRWQSTDSSNQSNQRYDVALGVSRSIPINLGRPLSMNTKLEFRHINQMSDHTGFDYIENRATANFAVRF
jgi:hypothetical protein